MRATIFSERHCIIGFVVMFYALLLICCINPDSESYHPIQLAMCTKDTTVAAGDTLILSADISNGCHPLKYEWKLGNEDNWTQTSVPEFSIHLPIADTNFVCSLKVTDCKGNAASEGLRVKTSVEGLFRSLTDFYIPFADSVTICTNDQDSLQDYLTPSWTTPAVNYPHDISNRVTIYHNVNLSEPGEYHITWSTTVNELGERISVTRTVNVVSCTE